MVQPHKLVSTIIQDPRSLGGRGALGTAQTVPAPRGVQGLSGSSSTHWS